MSYHYGQLELSPTRGFLEWYRTHLQIIPLDRWESRGVYTPIPTLLLLRASPETCERYFSDTVYPV